MPGSKREIRGRLRGHWQWSGRIGLGYLLAVAGIAAATLSLWALPETLANTPYLVFYPVIVAAAAFGGMGPGLAATAAAILCIEVLLTSPLWQLSIDPMEWARHAIFMAGAVSISVVAGMKRAAQDRQHRQEGALRRSEARLHAMFDNAAVGIVEVDSQDHFVGANDRICRILGYTREELLAINVHELTYPEDRPRSDQLNAQLHQGYRETIDCEKRYLKRDGSPLWVHVTVSAVHDAAGGSLRHIGTIEDIHERKQAEERIRQLNQDLQQRNAELEAVKDRLAADLAAMSQLHEISTRFVQQGNLRSLLDEIIRAAVCITNADMGKIQLADEQGVLRVVAHLGFDQTFVDLFSDIHAGQAACGTAMARQERVIVEDISRSPIFLGTPWLDAMLAAGVRAVQCTPLLSRSGRMLGVFSTHYRTSRRPADQDLQMLDLLARQAADYIERMQAEQALRHSEQRFRGTFQNAAVGIAHVDADGRFLRANQRLCEMLGYDDEELRGRSFTDFTHPEDQEPDRPQFAALMHGQMDSYTVEKRYTHKNGQPLSVLVTRSLQRDEAGHPLYSISIVQDISQRKQVEQQIRELNETLEQQVVARTAEAEARATQLRVLAAELTRTEQRERRRLATILHDHLQQLLVGAKFSVSILRSRLSDDEDRQSLEQVNELLDQSITASRSLTVELSPPVLSQGSMGGALRWLASWMRKKHGLTVQVTADDTISPDDEIRVMLFQSVRELLFNVVKHAKVDTASITMDNCGDGQVHILVADQGTGFDPTVPHRRSDAGTGLGLFGMHERLEVMGGRLQVDSALGQGTRVTLTAPLRLSKAEMAMMEAESSTAWESPATASGWPGRPGCIRVLVADDHAVVRDGLTRLLQTQADIEVIGTAADGQQALELAGQLQPDVVLMDVSMPRLNGIDATRQLRSQMREVCIIGLSMHAQDEMMERMRQAGANHYLTKSAPPEEVIAAIRTCSHCGEG